MPSFKITCMSALTCVSHNQHYTHSYSVFVHQGKTKRLIENFNTHFFLTFSIYIFLHSADCKGKVKSNLMGLLNGSFELHSTM